jgi:hypothetical protein
MQPPSIVRGENCRKLLWAGHVAGTGRHKNLIPNVAGEMFGEGHLEDDNKIGNDIKIGGA